MISHACAQLKVCTRGTICSKQVNYLAVDLFKKNEESANHYRVALERTGI